MNTSIGFADYSDEKLYERCKKWGSMILKARNIFLVMLPEVNRRRLFEKKGFESIFHFAKVIAGASEKHVRRVLNLDARFAHLPGIYSLFLSGKISINKFAKIGSVVTNENQEYWANKIQILPTRTLETLVRDYSLSVKTVTTLDAVCEDQKGLFELKNEEESVHVNTFEAQNEPKNLHGQNSQSTTVGDWTEVDPTKKSRRLIFTSRSDQKTNLKLSEKITNQLLELQQKNIDINALIQEALDRRTREIAEEKVKLAQKAETGEPATRRTPVKVSNILKKEHGTKCAVPTCTKLSSEVHHTNRFALSKNHNPYYMAPLCKQHHQIAHLNDQHYQVKMRR